MSGEIAYRGLAGPWIVKEIQFPVLAFDARPSDALVLPNSGGVRVRVRDAERPLRGTRGEPPSLKSWYMDSGGSMQFTAYIAERYGLYFDSRDPAGHIKRCGFAWHGKGRSVYSATHPLPRFSAGRPKYAVPYPVTLGIYPGGDWFHAATIYRRWALRQSWTRAARARRDAATVRRVRKIALWFWNRGSIANAVPPVEAFAEDLGLPVALDWYWWHKKPYDTGIPTIFRLGKAFSGSSGPWRV